MATSGIDISDEVYDSYQRVKKRGGGLNTVVYKVNEKKDGVIIAKEFENVSFEDLRAHIIESYKDTPAYVAHEFVYDNAEGTKQEKIVLFSWSPDTAGIKAKMIHTSTVKALKDKFQPQKYFEVHDLDEFTFAEVKCVCEK